MRKKLFRGVIYAVGILLLILTGFAFYVYSHKEELKQEALALLNQKLQTRIEVQQIGTNLYTQFPRVSIVLNHVIVQDAFNSEIPLLKASKVAIGFNIMDVIRKNYRITSIKIIDGETHLFVNTKGKGNYEIIKQVDNRQTGDEPMLVHLENIVLNQLRIVFDYKPSPQHYDVYINQAKWDVKFNPDIWELALKNDAYIQQIKIDQSVYLKDKPVTIDASLKYEVTQQRWQLKPVACTVADLSFNAEGTYQTNKKADELDININAPRVTITSLLSLLTVKPDLLNEWSSKGEASLNGYIRGKYSAKQQPELKVQFKVNDGILINSKKNIRAEQIFTSGEWYMSNSKSYLTLKDLKLQSGNSTISGNLSFNNLQKPFLDANIQATIDAADAIKWIPDEKIKSANGQMQINASIHAALKDLSENKRLTKEAIRGNVSAQLTDVVLAQNNLGFQKLDLKCILDNDLNIEDLYIVTRQSDAKINGAINGFAAMIFAGKPAQVNINLRSSVLHVSDFMFEQSSSNAKDTTPGWVKNLNIKADIDKLYYDKTTAEQFRATIQISDDVVSLNDISANIYGGSLSGNILLTSSTNNQKTLSTQIAYNAIDIKQLFEAWNNFNQKEITAAHLSGKLTGNLQLNTRINDNNEVLLPSLTAIAEMQVTQGGITNYEPLKKLSRFADVEDLSNLRFADLKNTLLIQNNLITIPEMNINTNAMNVTLSGTQAFDGMMDYKIRLKLSELLKRKRKAATDEAIEEDETGKGMYVFLTMKGYADNLKIAYDKTAVKQKMKQDIAEEKERIKDILKKELGLQKEATVKEKKNNSDELEFEQE